MGDRANVHVIDSGSSEGIYLYTHWDGSDLPLIVKGVLARRLRWNDSAYLCRMIFSALVRDDIDGECGYGISTFICDYEHPHTIVNCLDQVIRINGKEWSFDEFVDASNEEILHAYNGEDE